MSDKTPSDRTVAPSADAGAPRTAEARSADALTKHLGGLLKTKAWYQLPRFLATRNSSRSATSCARRTCTTPRSRRSRRAQDDPGRSGSGDPRRPHHRRHATTICNFPQMGAAGRRFGRNFPLEHTFPDTANLLIPNPRVVSRELMTRDTFKPATILNLLAGGVDPVHGARLVRPRAIEDRTSSTSRSPPGDDCGEPTHARAAQRCPIRRRPARRGRRRTPT